MKQIFYLLILIPLVSWGQNSEADNYKKQAEKFSENGQFDSANTKLLAAANVYERKGDWDGYLECGLGISKNLIGSGAYEEASNTAKSYAQQGEAKLTGPTETLAMLYKHAGIGHYALQQDALAAPLLSKALAIRESVTPNNPDLARDYNNVGVIYRFLGDYQKAILHLNRALVLQEKEPDTTILARLHGELGSNYAKINQYYKALEHQQSAIDLLKLQSPQNDYELALAGLNVAQTQIELKEYKRARTDLKNASKLLATLPITEIQNIHTNQIIAEQLIADTYLAENKYPSALKYYQSTLDLCAKHLPTNNEYSLYAHRNLGVTFTYLKKWEEAELHLSKASEMAQQMYASTDDKLADVREAYIQFYTAKGDFDSALNAFQSQFSTLIEGYSPSALDKLPSADQLEQSVSRFKLHHVLGGMSHTLLTKYQQNPSPNIKDLKLALEASKACDETITKIRQEDNSDNRYLYSDIILDAYETSIEVCLELWNATKETVYQEEAWYFSEKSKSLMLLENAQQQNAAKIAGLPQELLDQENALKAAIAKLEQELFSHQTHPDETSKKVVAELRQQLPAKRDALQAFIKKMEADYPEYAKLKYSVQLISLEDTRALLASDQALIEYFVGDNNVYAFQISADNFSIQKLANTKKIAAQVELVRKTIGTYFGGGGGNDIESHRKNMATILTQQSSELYKTLIQPLAIDKYKRLIVIPDGALSYLPFELLISEAAQDPQDFKKHNYLLQKYVLSYCFSATSLKQMSERKFDSDRKAFLGMAPSFGDGKHSFTRRGMRFALSPLVYSSTEVRDIQALAGGEILEGGDATEANFLSMAPNFKVIHLATHGISDDDSPDYSLMAFTEVVDTIENEFLYAQDLENIQLQAELVVLSACETGLGKLQRGEGVASMARGFAMAGAKSILMTLWSVNDQATSQIMEGFYKNMQSGYPKDVALQMAKIEFLEAQSSLTAHPYMWAPFVLIGDTTPIDIGRGTAWWIYLLGGLGTVAAFGLGRRLMRKKEIM